MGQVAGGGARNTTKSTDSLSECFFKKVCEGQNIDSGFATTISSIGFSQSTIGWSINNWKDRTIDNIASSTTGRYGSNTDIVTTRTSRTSLGTSDWCYKKCATIGAITPCIWCHGSYHTLKQANKYWRDFDSWWMLMQRPTALLSGGWANAIKFGTSTLYPTDRWFVIVRWSLESSGFAWHDISATVSDQWQMSRLDFYSHDRDFLLAVTNDMIVLNHQRLTNQRQMQERTALQRNNLEAAEKQLQKALEFVQKQQ